MTLICSFPTSDRSETCNVPVRYAFVRAYRGLELALKETKKKIVRTKISKNITSLLI